MGHIAGRQGCRCLASFCLLLPNALAESKLKASLCPGCVLLQAKGSRQHIFPGTEIRQLRLYLSLLSRQNGGSSHFLCPNLFALQQQRETQVKRLGIREEGLVFYGYALLTGQQREVLVVELHFLQLGGRTAVGKENAVTAEIVVRGTVPKIPAIAQGVLAIAILVPQGLIHEIPDKAPLIQGLSIRKLRVLVHAAIAVAHRMGVLAAKEGLVTMLSEEFLDVCHLGIHLAFHIAGAVVAAVPENALVVYQPGRVTMAEILAHLIDIPASAGLVAT